ncbi:MAG: hypothetical protein KDK99_21425 [Verrucomicrobiales bacterium]|nr:hypothetical protein [Verrucomicrobiales bacterium]
MPSFAGASKRICVPFSVPFSREKSAHNGPALAFAQFGALEVIGEEPFLLLRDRLGGNSGKLRRIGGEGGGGDKAGEREEAEGSSGR